MNSPVLPKRSNRESERRHWSTRVITSASISTIDADEFSLLERGLVASMQSVQREYGSSFDPTIYQISRVLIQKMLHSKHLAPGMAVTASANFDGAVEISLVNTAKKCNFTVEICSSENIVAWRTTTDFSEDSPGTETAILEGMRWLISM
jgi:hypothetical protein